MDDWDRSRLFSSMVFRQPIAITDASGKTHRGIVNTISAEDGSGWCFNIIMDTGVKFFYRARGRKVA